MTPETTSCQSCGRAVIESGRNWTHLDSSYRCAWPYDGNGWASPQTPINTAELRESIRQELHAEWPDL